MVRVRGRVAPLISVGVGFHPELTGRENVYVNGTVLGLTTAQIDELFDTIVDFAEIPEFIDLQVKHYSSGMYARLAFAVAVNVTPDIMLIDEVLSVGDEAFQRKCIDRVKLFQKEGRTIFLVTHAADLVRQMCDRAAVLDHGAMIHDGDPTEAVRIYRDNLRARGLEIPVEAMEREITREITIGRVDLALPDSADRSFVQSGERVRVTIPYKATQSHDDVVFAIHLLDGTGNVLFGTNSDIVEGGPHEVDGEGEYVFELGPLPLSNGTFFLDVGIHKIGGIEYDHRPKAADLLASTPGTHSREVGPIVIEAVGRLGGRRASAEKTA
jgi:ABC-2 type transport system ATP-binding protein